MEENAEVTQQKLPCDGEERVNLKSDLSTLAVDVVSCLAFRIL